MRVTSAAYLGASAASLAAAVLAPPAVLATSNNGVGIVAAGQDQQQQQRVHRSSTSNKDARLLMKHRGSTREKSLGQQRGTLFEGGQQRRISTMVDSVSLALRQGVIKAFCCCFVATNSRCFVVNNGSETSFFYMSTKNTYYSIIVRYVQVKSSKDPILCWHQL